MTQLQMTNAELNRALAEKMGYTVRTWEDGHVLLSVEGKVVVGGMMSEEKAWEDAPDYCNDSAASIEVQAAAIKIDARLYAINLAKHLKWDEDGDPLSYSDDDLFSYTGVANFFTTTPRQRAEAAYMTIQGANTDANPSTSQL